MPISFKNAFKVAQQKREAEIRRKSAAALRARKAENPHNPNAGFGTLNKTEWLRDHPNGY